jgi:hypothetical protein
MEFRGIDREIGFKGHFGEAVMLLFRCFGDDFRRFSDVFPVLSRDFPSRNVNIDINASSQK